MQGVLCAVQEHGALDADGKAAQTGSAGGDGDSHVEGEEGLAALGLAADDADGFEGPQAVDKPAAIWGCGAKLPGRRNRKRRHRRDPGGLGAGRWVGVKSSK